MTGTGWPRTAPPSAPIDRRDVAIMAGLLIVAILPVSRELVKPATQLNAAARIAVGWETVNRRALAEGSLPLWNPYEFGGRPHLANPETLALYPPHMLLRVLPPQLLFPLSFVLHAWLAGAGTYISARNLRASRPASAAAGGALLCGGLLMPFGEIAYSVDVYHLAWPPLIAAYALRSADRQTWLPHPGLVVVSALALTASPRGPMYVLATVIGTYLFAGMWPSSERPVRRLVGQPAVLACLAVGLTAFQIAPTVRLWTTMRGTNGLVTDVPYDRIAVVTGDRATADTLKSLGTRGRVLSICDRGPDGSQLVALGLPGISGRGGVFLADYARFASLARGRQEHVRTTFPDMPEAADGRGRADLLQLMGVEYLVSCAAPDPQRWDAVRESNGIGVYRVAFPPSRAFWTCAPTPVGREEIAYRLRRGSYDGRLVLQPELMVHIRWAPAVGERERARLESELHVAPRRDLGDRTWQYNLLDRMPENVAAIVKHPLVEDTQGIDRNTLALASSPETLPAFDEPKSEWLIGAGACEAPVPAIVRTQDQFDGGMSVEVSAPQEGVVFFSETYYRERRAWVDGQRVRPMKVNLAFTGVRVPAGTHHIELRYDTRALWVGAVLSVFTLLLWLTAERRARSARAGDAPSSTSSRSRGR